MYSKYIWKASASLHAKFKSTVFEFFPSTVKASIFFSIYQHWEVGIQRYMNTALWLSKRLIRWSKPLWYEGKWRDLHRRWADTWAHFLSIDRWHRTVEWRYLLAKKAHPFITQLLTLFPPFYEEKSFHLVDSSLSSSPWATGNFALNPGFSIVSFKNLSPTPEDKSRIAVIGSFGAVDVAVLEVCHFNEAIFDGRWMRALDLWNVQYKLDIVLGKRGGKKNTVSRDRDTRSITFYFR